MHKPWTYQDEKEIRKIFMQNLHAACSDTIRKFAECASNKTFSMIWKCRLEKKSMKECIRLNASPKDYDHAQDIYMKKVQEINPISDFKKENT